MSEELNLLRKKLIGTNIVMTTTSIDCEYSFFEHGLRIEEKEEGIVLTFGMLKESIKGKNDTGFVQGVYLNHEIKNFLEEEIEFLQELVDDGELSNSLLNDIKKYAELCN